MKKIFLAKRGLVSIIATCFLRMPISLIFSLITAYFFHELFQLNRLNVFLCIFMIFNLLFILKTSFVKIENNTIKYNHYLFGKKMRFKFEDIISYTVLDAKEYQSMCNNQTRNNNLSGNCMSVFIPLNRNVILFKDNAYQEIAICVHNFDEFYNYIRSNLKLDEQNLETKKVHSPETSSNIEKENLYGKTMERYFLKMSLIDYIVFFFKHFIVTIICPLIISAALSFAIVKVFDDFNYFVCFFVVFLLHSIYFYIFEILKVTNDKESKSLRINYKSIMIMYENIKDCHYISSLDEIRELYNCNNVFKTPFPINNWKNVIYIKLNNNKIFLLSIYNHKQLYDYIISSIGK